MTDLKEMEETYLEETELEYQAECQKEIERDRAREREIDMMVEEWGFDGKGFDDE